MPTPAEERGYKIGDLFKVKEGGGHQSLTDGSLIEFIADDGTLYPRFGVLIKKCVSDPDDRLEHYENWGYIHLDGIIKVCDSTNADTMKQCIARAKLDRLLGI